MIAACLDEFAAAGDGQESWGPSIRKILNVEAMAHAAVDCVVILGDSTSAGFATGGQGYPSLVGEALGANGGELVQVRTDHQLMVEEDLPRIGALRPDVVIVQAGMGDSLPHPGERVQRLSSDLFRAPGTVSTVSNVGPTSPVPGVDVPDSGRWPNSRPPSSGR